MCKIKLKILSKMKKTIFINFIFDNNNNLFEISHNISHINFVCNKKILLRIKCNVSTIYNNLYAIYNHC